MRRIRGIELDDKTREEQLPGFSPQFPYIATRAELDTYGNGRVPWHWHAPVELFYMESGELEYETPGGTARFPAGSGGMLLSNVLHKTRTLTSAQPNVQLLHIFDPALLCGARGGRVWQTYFFPLLADPRLELLSLHPEVPEQRTVLEHIRAAFRLSEGEVGYELELQRALLEIWLGLFRLYAPPAGAAAAPGANIDAAKAMMAYLREHYARSVTVKELAQAAFLSERECYRVFRQCLHTTPTDYLTDLRLQRACRLLQSGGLSITQVAQACGFGSSSYFGRVFLRRMGCTPRDYCRSWRDRTKTGRE